MNHRATRRAALCVIVMGVTFLLGCGGDAEVVRTPDARLHLPVRLEVGSTIRFRVEIEQQLSHGPDSTSTVKSDIQLALKVAKREGGALLIKVTRTGDGEGRDFQFHILPNHEFSRVKGFQFPSATSTAIGDYSIDRLTQPEFWLHDMLRPFRQSRFREGENWRISPVFDGVPFPIPMDLVAGITSVDAEHVTIEAKGDVAWAIMSMGARELMPWPKKSLRTTSVKAVVRRSDGLVENAELSLELTNDRDWTPEAGSFPEPDGKHHTVRHTIRVTRL
ncbi:MAG: hypothetical protein GY946_01610 [bacterium]|nr:hypothetical protein [bacterium]